MYVCIYINIYVYVCIYIYIYNGFFREGTQRLPETDAETSGPRGVVGKDLEGIDSKIFVLLLLLLSL